MSDENRKLPLPGEKPVTVWQPRTRRRQRPWQRNHGSRRVRLLRTLAPWLAAAALLFVGLRIWRAASTHVTLIVNGEPASVSTHRRTVQGAARTGGIRLDDTLFIDPPGWTPLEEGMLIVVAHQRPVIVRVDGERLVTSSHLLEPEAIIQEMGIALGPDDSLAVIRAAGPGPSNIAADPALAGVPSLPREIEVRRAHRVIVSEAFGSGEPTRVSFQTSAPTLGEALYQAGYALYEADFYDPPLHTPIQADDLEVHIQRALPVTVHADGREIAARTHQPTVGALLGELSLAADGEDYVLPAPETPLSPGQVVRLVRVEEKTLVEQEAVPFETITVPDPDLELDQQREVQAGQAGSRERHTRVRYEDGVEVSRVLEGEWITHEPEPRVVAYGTRIIIRTLSTPWGDLHYWRKLRVLATSYSPLTAGHKQPGDPFFGLSGTGDPVQRGIIATDPRVISLYTRMYVPGYGIGQARDVGGAVKGLRIDLGYDDENLVLWNNWVDIYLLTPVPSFDQIAWVLPG